MPTPSSTTVPRASQALFAVTAALFFLRLGWILREPDLDSDAYGHLAIGHKLAVDPWNLTHHGVWLPLYHDVLAGFVRLHVPFAAVRIFASLCEVGDLERGAPEPLSLAYSASGTKARHRQKFACHPPHG